MAATRNNIVIHRGASQTFQTEMIVASGTTASILPGMPCKMSTAKAAAMVDGDGTTSQLFVGITKGQSTETSGATGIVQLWAPVPGVIYRGAAKTASLANTQALIDALVGKRVVFDRTADTAAGLYTVDTAAADATTNCVSIIGGNPLTSEIEFFYSVNGTALGNPTT